MRKPRTASLRKEEVSSYGGEDHAVSLHYSTNLKQRKKNNYQAQYNKSCFRYNKWAGFVSK